METNKLRSQIVSGFKINGLSLRSEASTLLVEVLEDVGGEGDVRRWLDKIIETVQKQPLTSSFITRDVVEIAVNECREGGDEEGDKIFNIIDAFKVRVCVGLV